MNMRKFWERSTHGKGGYIAAVLCAIAIGITGFLYFRNANKDSLSGQNPDSPNVSDQVAALSTLPGSTTAPTSGTTVPKLTEKAAMKTASPLEGQTVAVYAMDSLDYNTTTRDWRVHNGVDIAAEAGSTVCAAADGVVYTVYEDETMGMTVVIRHADGYVTKYSSLDKAVQVVSGEEVTLGQPIGYVGETALLETAEGAHVHFSVTKDGEPMDPAEFCMIGS